VHDQLDLHLVLRGALLRRAYVGTPPALSQEGIKCSGRSQVFHEPLDRPLNVLVEIVERFTFRSEAESLTDSDPLP
jgi:hypothetical protein